MRILLAANIAALGALAVVELSAPALAQAAPLAQGVVFHKGEQRARAQRAPRKGAQV